MFYSHLLLSKKGVLGIVWMAAHCHKRLKKEQILQTNVSASVDKIVYEEVPVVTHRILAFLLLGVVRIYAKKVEYLFNDCHDMLNKLCGGFDAEKTKHVAGGAPQKYFHSIALPNSFELDAFDLELVEDEDLVGGNVGSHNQIMLAEVRGTENNVHSLLYKENTTNTPPRDVLSPHFMNQRLLLGPSINKKISLADLEIVPGQGFSLEDCMEPMMLDESEEEEMHSRSSKDSQRAITAGATEEMVSDSVDNLIHNICTTLPSWDVLRGNVFSLEDPTDLTVLDGAGEEQSNDKLSGDNMRTEFPELIQDIELNHDISPLTQRSDFVASSGILHSSDISLEHSLSLKTSSEVENDQGFNEPSYEEHRVTEKQQTQLSFQVDDLHNFPETVDKTQQVVANKKKLLEVITQDSRDCQNTDLFPTSTGAPNPKLPDTGSPEIANILTPASKERGKIQKKRKVLCDLTTILPNAVMKKWLGEDLSDLKRERKTVPKTPLQAWRACKLGRTTEGLIEPLISGMSVDLSFLQCEKSCAAAVAAVEVSATPDYIHSPITHGVNEQMLDVQSPVIERSLEETRLAPWTPIACSIPLQSHEVGAAADSGISEPTLLAPGTPVPCLIPLRSHEIGAAADSDILEHSTSLRSLEKSVSSNGGLELDAVFCEEINSCDGDSMENYTFSARTRKLGSYLHGKFLDKSRKNKEEVLNVSKLLEGKTKKESARLFYDILILKSRGCVDVQQEDAYGDIMLREASQLQLAI